MRKEDGPKQVKIPSGNVVQHADFYNMTHIEAHFYADMGVQRVENNVEDSCQRMRYSAQQVEKALTNTDAQVANLAQNTRAELQHAGQ